MTYEDLILTRLQNGLEYTTQGITESLFKCKKGDAIYNNHVEDVGKDLQKLWRKGKLTKEGMDKGHGYMICIWKVKD